MSGARTLRPQQPTPPSLKRLREQKTVVAPKRRVIIQSSEDENGSENDDSLHLPDPQVALANPNEVPSESSQTLFVENLFVEQGDPDLVLSPIPSTPTTLETEDTLEHHINAQIASEHNEENFAPVYRLNSSDDEYNEEFMGEQIAIQESLAPQGDQFKASTSRTPAKKTIGANSSRKRKLQTVVQTSLKRRKIQSAKAPFLHKLAKRVMKAEDNYVIKRWTLPNAPNTEFVLYARREILPPPPPDRSSWMLTMRQGYIGSAPLHILRQPYAFIAPWAHWPFVLFPAGFPLPNLEQTAQIINLPSGVIQITLETNVVSDRRIILHPTMAVEIEIPVIYSAEEPSSDEDDIIIEEEPKEDEQDSVADQMVLVDNEANNEPAPTQIIEQMIEQRMIVYRAEVNEQLSAIQQTMNLILSKLG